MDRLESLGNTLSNLTMYDIKSAYNQAKNVVLNVSEMEAKVREATNDDPWGASSSLMQEIAQGTFSFQHFNEIMPAIYSRFMEKEAREWRQIYKALQLLEYLVKHGSERVVDDARSHTSTMRMLRSFHYIDEKGKDQGINVRNRAKELVELLGDVDKIRGERRKAKANKHKYTGTGNDGSYGADMSFNTGGSRYGGFGSDSHGGGSSSYETGRHNDHYQSGGSSFRDESRRAGGFEEYNAGDDEDSAPRRSSSISTSTTHARTGSLSTSARIAAARKREPAPAPPPAPVPEVDLLGGLDDEPINTTSTGSSNTNKALPFVSTPAPAVSLDDDDFADFQAAPSSPPPMPVQAQPIMPSFNTNTAASPPPTMQSQGHRQQPSLGGLGSLMSPQVPKPTTNNSFSGVGPNYTSSPLMAASPPPTNRMQSSSASSSAKPSVGFDDLWNMSLGSSTPKPAAGGGKSMNDLQKEKTNAGLWGAQKPPGAADSFGSFGGSFGGSSTSNSNSKMGGGDDDLLL